jgi:hypothetical protein
MLSYSKETNNGKPVPGNYYSLLLLISLVITNSSFALAKETEIQDIPVITDTAWSVDKGYIDISFKLKNGYTKEMEQSLKSGTPVTIIYDIECIEDGILWNSTVASLQIVRNLYYDVIKGHFHIGFGTQNKRIVNVKAFKDASPLLFHIKNQHVIASSKLSKGNSYIIRVRASAVRKSNVLMPFKPLVSLFSSWGYTTEWNEVSFRY